MKYRLFLSLILMSILALPAIGQPIPKSDTDEPLKLKIIGSIGLEPGVGAYHTMLFADAELGMRINHSFEIGAYYATSLNGLYPYGFERTEYLNYFDHGGIWLGYIFQPKKDIHPFIRIKSGQGNFAIGMDLGENYNNLPCFVVQPSAGFEYNIVKYFKISLEVYYRYASSTDIYLYKTDNPGGTGINLRFTAGIPGDI